MIEEVGIDYDDYSNDVPEELRMIHRFLRESNQLKFKFIPDYARFKWMAKNIFLYVGLDRTLIEPLYQKICTRAQRAAAYCIANRCVEEMIELERLSKLRLKIKLMVGEYVQELSEKNMVQLIERICEARSLQTFQANLKQEQQKFDDNY